MDDSMSRSLRIWFDIRRSLAGFDIALEAPQKLMPALTAQPVTLNLWCEADMFKLQSRERIRLRRELKQDGRAHPFVRARQARNDQMRINDAPSNLGFRPQDLYFHHLEGLAKSNRYLLANARADFTGCSPPALDALLSRQGFVDF